jgi:hypothetical protein
VDKARSFLVFSEMLAPTKARAIALLVVPQRADQFMWNLMIIRAEHEWLVRSGERQIQPFGTALQSSAQQSSSRDGTPASRDETDRAVQTANL